MDVMCRAPEYNQQVRTRRYPGLPRGSVPSRLWARSYYCVSSLAVHANTTNAAKVLADSHHPCRQWRRGGGDTSLSAASIIAVVKNSTRLTNYGLDKLVERGNDPHYSFTTLFYRIYSSCLSNSRRFLCLRIDHRVEQLWYYKMLGSESACVDIYLYLDWEVCVFFILNRSFYPSTSSTISVRDDSSILEEILVLLWSQSYATETLRCPVCSKHGSGQWNAMSAY